MVDQHVADWTIQLDRAELLSICETHQVPCGPVYAIDEIFEDPQYAARGNILKMVDDRIGEMSIPNLVPRLSDTPGSVNWLGPKLGEHNDEVFKGLLDMADDEIRKLQSAGVI
jgi:succinyl-CoA:(S)-malate CoA-transferase subunit B